jgi:hypothetical protein
MAIRIQNGIEPKGASIMTPTKDAESINTDITLMSRVLFPANLLLISNFAGK